MSSKKQQAGRCPAWSSTLSDPALNWDIFSASNHICVQVGKLAERPELTEGERAAINAAYLILSYTSGDILRRTAPHKPPAGTQSPVESAGPK